MKGIDELELMKWCASQKLLGVGGVYSHPDLQKGVVLKYNIDNGDLSLHIPIIGFEDGVKIQTLAAFGTDFKKFMSSLARFEALCVAQHDRTEYLGGFAVKWMEALASADSTPAAVCIGGELACAFRVRPSGMRMVSCREGSGCIEIRFDKGFVVVSTVDGYTVEAV